MLEKDLEHRVNKWASDQHIIHLKMRPHVVGYPDDIYLYSGKAVFIEYKTEHGRLSPIQERRIATLRYAGFPVEVCRDFESATRFLGAALLSRDGSRASDKPSMSGSSTPPWDG